MTRFTIGIDIAKRVFQVHAIDNETGEVTTRKLARRDFLAYFEKLPPSLIGMETCGSAHHWARELSAMGHEVRMMNPMYVKPYVKRGKNDVVDAEAICEALTRPTMRFVPVKTIEQQSVMAVHRTRALLIRQRTMLANALRGHLAEFGIVAPLGIERVLQLIDRVLGREGDEHGITPLVRSIVSIFAEQFEKIKEQIGKLERELRLWHRTSEASRRVASVPGVGMVTATAIVAAMPDSSTFEFRAIFRGMARPHAEVVVIGRKGAQWADHQGRQPAPPRAARSGRNISSAAGPRGTVDTTLRLGEEASGS